MQQATAAVIFADKVKKKIRFHINADRIEQKGDPILKNIENLFKNSNNELVKHNWLNHEDFLNLVSAMDLGSQVSYSESFNIVAADFVYKNIPIVGSPDIEWLNGFYQANPNNCNNIVNKLYFAYKLKPFKVHLLNKYRLMEYNKDSTDLWLNYLGEI